MPTPATGTAMFSDNPLDGDAVTLNGATLTFRNNPDSAYEVLVGSGLADTRANLLSRLQWLDDPRLRVASYASEDIDTIQIMHNTPGAAGNSYALDETGDAISFSGTTLTGGSN